LGKNSAVFFFSFLQAFGTTAISFCASSISSIPDLPNTLEFRHESWFQEETEALLRERGVAMCIVSAPNLPEYVVATAAHAFVRFHGKGAWYAYRYSMRELRTWAERIKGLPVKRVFIYFNNDWNAWAPENALQLEELLLSHP